ncbi:hypothetical protein PILCRDRAFT_432463 [Piloderma croceum F 1598]|uniref:CCHC-type domain-containing protein n=1 Tax=Piloderma croceum (strain F 1598) TaxID=765440 RepID=A0A0C3FZL9_PILCF|nr:hypothetical protein PILCRDRAFT_432463 [Piloderma croceum F 1598]
MKLSYRLSSGWWTMCMPNTVRTAERVCWRCGRENHVARNCVADMPDDVKRKVANHANIVTTSPDEGIFDSELFAFASGEAIIRFVNPSRMVPGSNGNLNPDERRTLHGNATHIFIIIIWHIHLLHSFTYFIQGVIRLDVFSCLSLVTVAVRSKQQ